MKTWEMIKGLTENPKNEYETGDLVAFVKYGIVRVKSKDTGLSYGAEGNIRINEYNANKEDDWQLVREPVDFMTAVNSGKEIRSEFWAEDDTLCTDDTASKKWIRVSLRDLRGKWYIQD